MAFDIQAFSSLSFAALTSTLKTLFLHFVSCTRAPLPSSPLTMTPTRQETNVCLILARRVPCCFSKSMLLLLTCICWICRRTLGRIWTRSIASEHLSLGSRQMLASVSWWPIQILQGAICSRDKCKAVVSRQKGYFILKKEIFCEPCTRRWYFQRFTQQCGCQQLQRRELENAYHQGVADGRNNSVAEDDTVENRSDLPPS